MVRKRQGAITRLQDYTLFLEPRIPYSAYLYHNCLYILIFICNNRQIKKSVFGEEGT